MNVFFLDYRCFRNDAWSYIVQILKVNKVFSFVEPSTFCPLCYGFADVMVKDNTKEAMSQIAYYIANLAKKPIYTPDGDFLGYDDLDLFQNSNCNRPENNISDTDDPNIIVLGILTHSVVDNSVIPHFNIIEDEDSGLFIAGYTLNILNKLLCTDKYKKRISFFMADFVNIHDYITTGEEWVTRPRLYNFLTWELHKKFPQIYQFRKDYTKDTYEIANLFSEFYNSEKDKVERKYQKEIKILNYDDELLYDGPSWQDETDEMNRQFWNECGDAINEM